MLMLSQFWLTENTPRGTVPSHTIHKLLFKHALMHFCVRLNKSNIINTVQKKKIFKKNKDQNSKICPSKRSSKERCKHFLLWWYFKKDCLKQMCWCLKCNIKELLEISAAIPSSLGLGYPPWDIIILLL